MVSKTKTQTNRSRPKNPIKQTIMQLMAPTSRLFTTRLLLSLFYIEVLITSWGWITTGLPQFDRKHHKEVFSWFSTFCTAILPPFFGIWTSDETFKVKIDFISVALFCYTRVYFLICIIVCAIIPIAMTIHAVHYHANKSP